MAATVKYFLRNPDWKLERATLGSSCFELRADLSPDAIQRVRFYGRVGTIPENASPMIILPPGGRVLVPTGLHLEMDHGTEAQVRTRSGTGLKHGVMVAMGVGTVDCDYRGEVFVALINTDWDHSYEISNGDRVAQIAFCHIPTLVGVGMMSRGLSIVRVDKIEDLEKSDRGDGGFGSTGQS